MRWDGAWSITTVPRSAKSCTMRPASTTAGHRSSWVLSKVQHFSCVHEVDYELPPVQIHITTHCSARNGRGDRPALSGCHGACSESSNEAGESFSDVLRAERHGHGVLVAEGRGQKLRILADS